MASAGKILIMPKGDYNSSTTYEMLDLVNHNGLPWLAKKTVVGVAPSESASDYWHPLFGDVIQVAHLPNLLWEALNLHFFQSAD